MRPVHKQRRPASSLAFALQHLLDYARLMNGRALAWPLTSDVCVPIEAVPDASVLTPGLDFSVVSAPPRSALAGVAGAGGAAVAPAAVQQAAPRLAIRLKTPTERAADAAGGALPPP